MKSIPLALSWEFWRQAWGALLCTVIFLVGFIAFIYQGFRLGFPYGLDATVDIGLQLFCFLFVVVGLVAVVCGATESPQYRFTLPVSTRTSVLVPTLNGAFATAIGYLAVALLANGLFDARWTLVKPTLFAVCLFSVCQAVAWMIWSSPNLRAPIVAGVCAAFCVGISILLDNTTRDPRQFVGALNTIQPLELALAILIPLFAYFYSFGIVTLARRGQVFSMTAIGRWLIANLDRSFDTRSHRLTPMAAESWSEWMRRGRLLLAGPMLIAAILCGLFLSGRYNWVAARDAISALTWMQVMIGSILGLFIGHVGERFDFHEHLATRPLSDMQLADVKLRNALKVVLWTWIMWAIGVALAVLCLTLVGHGPRRWTYIMPDAHPLPAIISVVMIPLCSWTLTSLGVSIVILRPWLVKTGMGTLALLPAAPYALLYLMPESENEIFAATRWSWIAVTIGGTLALYVTAFRLRLISLKRVAVVGASYWLFCAACLLLLSLLPPIEFPRAFVVAFLLSSCTLPFICIAAVPLAVWWNRHR